MGQSKNQSKYRDGDSSNGKFLSPTVGTVSNPMRFLPYAISVFGLAFLASCLTASVMTPVENSDAAQVVQASIDDSGYFANVTASDVVDLSLIATQDGAITTASDTITVTTNSATGYKLYISSDSTSANSNHLNGSGDATGYHLSPVAGTTTTPIQLTDNSWGYSLTTLAGNNGTVTSSSNFIGMPLLNNENLLKSYTSPAPSGNNTVIYYGVKANTALASGYYTSRVVYTVVAEGEPASDGTINLSDNEATSLTPSKTITISTGLYTSALNIGTVSVKIGTQDCGNITPSTSNSGEVKINCLVPSQSALGDYDVAVSIPKFDKTYNLENGFHYYIPWENMTEMQEMTSYACNKVGTPSAYTSDAPTYSYGNGVTETQIKANPSSYWTTDVVNGAQMTNIYGDTNRNGTSVPEKTLTDTRDGNTYKIRKLADGNCWMVENLRLTWAAGDEIETANGEIWEPQKSTIMGNDTDTNVGTAWGYNDTSHDSEMPSGLDENGKKNWRVSYYDRSYKYGTKTLVDLDGNSQAVGVYYNWKAATAGTGVWEMADGQNATDSICPKGWQLPTGSGSKSWNEVFYAIYGNGDVRTGDRRVFTILPENATYKDYHAYALTAAIRRSPASLLFSGLVNYTSGDVNVTGGDGHFWTLTFGGNAISVNMGVHFGAFSPIAYDYNGYGFSVRCVNQ